MTLRIIDLFSGIGGFTLAADWLGGFATVQFVEREPFCQRILRKHWPDVPIHDDICTFNPALGSADVVVGGFPCQDISVAGKQAGIKEGTRSGLFYELIRIVRAVGPRYIVLENVANITSNGLGTVLGELAKAGYDCEWACIPASAVGACHQRDRWWCVAYATGSGSSNWIGTRYRALETKAAGRLEHESERCSSCAANTTGEQCDDLRVARPGGQAKSESGDGDRADAANANNKGLQGQWQELELPESSQQKTSRWSCQPRMPESDWRRFVSEPVLRRGDDGLSNRTHRLRALGNAVVPQVAMIPLARVLALASADNQ